MTVTFKTQKIKNLPQFSLDDAVGVMTKSFDKEKPSLHQSSQWWVTRVFRTTSNKPPLNWVPYDHSCYGTMEDVESGFLEWIAYLGKNTDLTGFKVSTMCLDMLNGTGEVAKQFCKEHFQPKEKIFINGPKKKPFPTKAAKHYAV